MRSVEVSGKTLEEARSLAAQQLGVSDEEISVEILEEPRKLFGILGPAEYRIRATAAEAEETAVAQESPMEHSQDTTAHYHEDEPDGDAQAVGEAALETIATIISLMQLEATPSLRSASLEEVVIDIEGPDAGRLIGRHGAGLDALQLVTAVIANRKASAGARVLLDAEGYRERREKMLIEMALSHAEKAKAAGKEIVIRDLKPYERRIIHLALKEDPDVETYSEGQGEDRQLVISPRV
ncbi:MAG: Jag N-terminal domain-containing protein [Armatimonadetes bacterium]|nr:Jag N-terminal domain-containing protein [Armatimonadota bacterium]